MLSCSRVGYLGIWQFLCGIWCPFNVTTGQVARFKEKVIWVDLIILAFMRHRFSHFSN